MSIRQFDSEYPDWNENISKYMPNVNFHPDNLQLYANFMVFVSILGCIPIGVQAYKVYKTKETKGLFIYAFLFQALLSTLWIIYGIISRIGVIVISSTLILSVTVILVLLIFLYQNNLDS